MQKQLEEMENKIAGKGGDMAKMMEQLQNLSSQTEMIGKVAGGLGKKMQNTIGDDDDDD